MRRRGLLVSACAAALGAPALVRAKEPKLIRFGWANTPAQLIPLVFQNTKILKHYGRSYVARGDYFRGSTPQITGLATGDLEIAGLAFSSFALAIQNAHMRDVRLVGDMYQDGVAGYYSSQYCVRAGSPITKVEQLKGKVLASNGLGGAIDMAMRKMCLAHGLIAGRDYRIIEVEFPAMPAMLNEGKVDLAGMVAPFSLIEIPGGRARSLFTLKDAMGVAQTTLLAARAPFIAANRPVLVDFFEDLQRGTQWFLDPANRKAAIALVADFTHRSPSIFDFWLFTHGDYYRDPAVVPNASALQNNINVQKELGFLKIDIKVAEFTDLSLVHEAAARTKT